MLKHFALVFAALAILAAPGYQVAAKALLCDPAAALAALATVRASGDKTEDVAALRTARDALNEALLACLPPRDTRFDERPRVDTSSRRKPVPVGTVLRAQRTIDQGRNIQQYEIAVTEVHRGKAAETMLPDIANDNRVELPETGKEYVLAYIEMLHLPTSPESVLRFEERDFEVISNGEASMATVFILRSELKFEANLYPDARTAGWLLFQVYNDDPAPVLELGFNDNESAYLALAP